VLKAPAAAPEISRKPGIIGTNISSESWVCASLKFLAWIEISIWMAGTRKASGSSTRKIEMASAAPKRMLTPSPSKEARAKTATDTSSVTAIESREKAAAASHLPVARADDGTAWQSSDSSEPRSRSPAVVSIATFMPPTKAASRKKSGSEPSTRLARAMAVEMSSGWTRSGWVIAGSTPRESSRQREVSRPKASSCPCRRRSARPAAGFEESWTSRTLAGRSAARSSP
jgi:hypothetical protein